MDVAVPTMLLSMFAAMLGMFWHLIRENTKTRELMVHLNHDTRTELLTALDKQGTELRADNKELRADLNTLGTELRAEHKSLAAELRADHKSLGAELRSGLSAVRERLSRIEGHFGIGIDPPQPDEQP